MLIWGYMPHLPPVAKPTKGYRIRARPMGEETPSHHHITIDDLTGKKFGYLILQERIQTPYGCSYLCLCTRPKEDGTGECGRKLAVHASQMLRGEKKSCGCGSKSAQAKKVGT